MTIFHFLNYCTILLIMFICCLLTHFISKGVDFSIFKAFIKMFLSAIGKVFPRVAKYGDIRFFLWYFKNPVFLFAIGLRMALIALVLYQITMFTRNSIFQRPPFFFTVSPIMFASLFGFMAIGLPMITKYLKRQGKI